MGLTRGQKTAVGVGLAAVVVGGGLAAALAMSRKPPSGAAPSVSISAQIVSQGYMEEGYQGAALEAGAAPVTVQFTADISGGLAPFAFVWDFGDGSPAGAGNPVTHTYSAEADYTVSVSVTDQAGEKASASGGIAVTTTSAVSLTGPQSAQTGAAVSLSATLKDGLGNPLEGEAVAFFQGSTKLGTATTDGSGVATLNATAPSAADASTPYSASFAGIGDYLSGSTSNTVEVDVYSPLSVTIGGTSTGGGTTGGAPPAPAPLSVSATAAPSSGEAPLKVQLTASAQGGVPPYAYQWYFEGAISPPSISGNPATQSLWNEYGSNETYYTCGVTVTDSAGNSAQGSATVTVTPNPDITFVPGDWANLPAYEVVIVDYNGVAGTALNAALNAAGFPAGTYYGVWNFEYTYAGLQSYYGSVGVYWTLYQTTG
jgi:hypothetical protein